MRCVDVHKIRLLVLGLLAAIGAAQSARATIDLSGVWLIIYHEEWREVGTGPDIGDYAGLPINEAARRRALAWHPSLINQPERQCAELPLEYTNAWSHTRIWQEYKPDSQDLLAIHIHKQYGGFERTIWMDGRPRPAKNALHTIAGFSLGEWDGDKLKVTTTHLKEGYIRRNGVPRSDKATIVEHFIRHGDHLTISTITQDPLYLTEPRIRSSDYQLSLTQTIGPYPCESVIELASWSKGFVPSFFPWKNPHAREFAEKFGLPLEGAHANEARHIYPQFIEPRAQ
jgi:hypothetical protein